MKTIQEIRNELFKRTELNYVLEAEINPNFNEMKKEISKKTGKSEECIDVFNIKGTFGTHSFKIKAYVYDTPEDLKKAIQKTKKQRKAEAEAEKQRLEEEKKKAEEDKQKAEQEASESPEAESVKEKEEEIVEKEVEKVEEGKESIKEAEKEIAEEIAEEKQ